jgi:hypothetical protein
LSPEEGARADLPSRSRAGALATRCANTDTVHRSCARRVVRGTTCHAGALAAPSAARWSAPRRTRVVPGLAAHHTASQAGCARHWCAAGRATPERREGRTMMGGGRVALERWPSQSCHAGRGPHRAMARLRLRRKGRNRGGWKGGRGSSPRWTNDGVGGRSGRFRGAGMAVLV